MNSSLSFWASSSHILLAFIIVLRDSLNKGPFISRYTGLRFLKIHLAGPDPGDHDEFLVHANLQEKFKIQAMFQVATWAQLFEG